MRASLSGFALALALTVSAAPLALAGVSADLNLHVGDRRAPVVVFDREPDVILVPNTRVYAVSGLDYDLFRYGQYWYINDSGYWYRARNYRGPFASIRFDYVPRQIVIVPERYHRHPLHPLGGPPGQMKKRAVVVDRDGDVRVIRGKDKHRGHDRD
ncbi:MAG: hypothetical protein ABI960_05470 [Candidatus Eisenbacteria bacterium]